MVYHQCYHYGRIFHVIQIHLKQKIHLWLVCIINIEINLIAKSFIGNGLLVYPVTEADINQVSVYFPGENTVRRMKK